MLQNYDFLIVNTGVDKRSSMLRSRHRRHSSAALRAFQREQRPIDSITSPSHRQNGEETLESSLPVVNDLGGEDLAQESPPYQPMPNVDVDELASSLSSLKFVPPSVRFGRGGRRGGLSRT